MSQSDRRTFLKQAAVVVPAIAVGGQSLSAGEASASTATASRRSTTLDGELLHAIGEAVLPLGTLGEDGARRVVTEFQAWLDAYEPVAELDHPYLTHELRYAPEDPGPRWQAQLQALDAEALKRHGASFVALDVAGRRSLIERQLRGDSLGRLPNAARARHVTVGMLAYFYASSEANDLCYQARIGRHECRGLENLSAPPEALGVRSNEELGAAEGDR